MASREWFDTLEKCQVLIYRRPNFLADDFEYEQYIGHGVLCNLFKTFQVSQQEDITLPFPERWINCIECHQLFPRLQAYYPNLKRLMVKTHAPLIITNVPNKFAFIMPEEDSITRTSGGHGKIGEPTSIEDVHALFKDISKGKMFTV